MKKKLIQILMLLVATVSVGSFVSCKDTNEDLYNELRTQAVSDNSSLQDALDQQKAALEDLIQKYKDLLANLPKACECDKDAVEADIAQLKTDVAGLKDAIDALGVDDLKNDVNGLKTDLAGLRAAILALQDELNDTNVELAGLSASFTSEIAGLKNLIELLQTALTDKVGKAEFDATINGLTAQINNIKDGLKALEDQNLLALINTNKALQDGLKDRIENLENQLAGLKSCTCNYDGKFTDYDGKFIDIFQRLAEAERAIIDNKAWVDQQLADIKGDVAAAQTAADNAATLANTANTNAELAMAEAKRIEGLANAAQQAADKAQGDATAAQQAAQNAQNAADLAYALAAQALSTANKANDLANTVNTLVAGLTGRVDANEKNIAQLQQDARDLLKLINDNKDKLQEAIDKVNSDLEKKIDDLKSDIQGKIDDLKGELQGKIDDLDGKLQEKVFELIGKITEVNNGVIANTENIKKNAENIAKNAESIKANADAISKINEQLSDFNTRITLATEEANKAYKEATDAKAKAEANEKSIADLRVDVGVNEANIKNLEKVTDELKEAIKGLQDKMSQIDTNTANIDALQDAVDGIKGNLKDITDKYDNLKDELADLKTQLAEAKKECEKNLLDAKAYVDTQLLTLKAAVTKEIADALNNYYDKDDLNKILEGYATQKDLNGLASQDDLDQLEKDLSSLDDKFYQEVLKLYDKITEGDQSLDDKIYDLAQRVAKNEQHLEDIDKVLREMADKYVDREVIMNWCQTLYLTLKGKIDAVDGKVDGLKDELKTYIVNYLKGEDFNFITKDDLDDLVTDLLKDKVDPEKFAQALEDLANLKKRVADLEKDRVKVADYKLDQEKVWKAIDTATEEIGKLKKAVKEINDALPTMKKDIENLQKDVKEAKEKIEKIDKEVKKVKGDVEAIQSYLAGQITSIAIQGTYNPMFGSFSIPANIQSNMLIAYYGRPMNKVEFPTTDPAPYTMHSKPLTDDDWAMLGLQKTNNREFNKQGYYYRQSANTILTNEDANGKSNAGKIYVTVNPVTAPAEGLNLKIVNSRDEVSLITLTPLKKSDQLLEFGFTRANNGFYEADAYVEKTSLESVETLEFDESSMMAVIDGAREEIAKMARAFFLDSGETGELGKVAVNLYQVLRELKLEQKGLKCPYDFDKETNTYNSAVYSQYNLAATAIKPLTLQSLKDLDYGTIPGYEPAMEWLMGNLAESLKGYMRIYFQKFEDSWTINELRGIEFDGVKLLNDAQNLIAKFALRVSHFTMDGKGYYFDIPAGGSVDVMFDKDLTNDGKPVTIPAAYAYDKTKCNADRTTLVISGDITNGLKTLLVIPARSDDDNQIAAYATMELTDTKANLVAGVIQVTDNNGKTYDVASFAGNAIDNAAYATTMPLSNLQGTKGSVDVPVVTEITGDLKDLLNTQGDVLKTLTDIVSNLNHFLDQIDHYEVLVGNDLDDFLNDKLVKYLNKINNTTTWFFKSVNRRFGPFMVASNDSKGFKILSTTKYHPTEMDAAALKFYPTTKNLELLVPIARKHVGVTNVFVDGDLSTSAQGGDATCLNKLKAANTNEEFNTVIDGTERCIQVNKLEAGYIYELAYSVLDFDGNISTQKYYVKVK